MTPILSIHVGEVNSSRCILGKAKLISCFSMPSEYFYKPVFRWVLQGITLQNLNMQKKTEVKLRKVMFRCFSIFYDKFIHH